jgi:hypothetical protein
MKGTWLVGVALVAAIGAVGCGGRQILLQPPDDSGTASAGEVPPILLSCDNGVGTIALDNPCLVGHALNANGSEAGPHAVECRLSASSHPVAWSFVLSLPTTQNPVTGFPPVPGVPPVDVGGRRATVTNVAGALMFSLVDPSNRAFVARFTGVITWTDTAGATFSCSVDAPLAGAPGAFT